MSDATDATEPVAGEPWSEVRTWRLLVGMQAAVIAVILLSILVIFLVGLFGSLFVQRAI